MKRHLFTTNRLLEKKGRINLAYMMNLLRNHNIKNSEAFNKWNPSKGTFEGICLHARPIFVLSQSTGSMVSHLKSDIQTHWFTATSAPCTSIFKPTFIDVELPDTGPTPSCQHDNKSLWWTHEKIHRNVLKDYQTRILMIKPDIIQYEEKWIKNVEKVIEEIKNHSLNEKKNKLELISKKAFQEAQEIEKKWIRDLEKIPIKKQSGRYLYRKFWKKESEKAGLYL